MARDVVAATRHLQAIHLDVDSIDSDAFGVYSVVEDDDAPDVRIAWVERDVDATDAEWQYVISTVAAALNDPTSAASTIRAKGRREVRKYVQ
jgi:hypothetical protein